MFYRHAMLVLLTFAIAALLILLRSDSVIVSYHIVFAIGIVPLIVSAMIHFAPVLTRSKQTKSKLSIFIILTLIAGLLTSSYFAFPNAVPLGHYVAATINMMTIIALGYWMITLKRKAIDRPHPCLDWYLAALICLLFGLAAIVMTFFVPKQATALRLVHLHLNTLGFIGITALATLQVLLPTTAQQPDPLLATRMRRHLKWLMLAIVAIAGGAAWYPPLSWFGLSILLWLLFIIMKSWLSLYFNKIMCLHGTTSSLAIALCGYIIAVIMGAVHAHSTPSINPTAIFIIAFLMPLVTAAITHLLPLWLWPGQQTQWHQHAWHHLGTGSTLRSLVFVVSGILAGIGLNLAWLLVIVVMALFISQVFDILITAQSVHNSMSNRPNTK